MSKQNGSSVRNGDKSSAYARAGVDIDQKMKGIASIKKMAASTATKGALSGIGYFGGMFASPGANKVLVASTDGVGTKLKVAALAGRHDTVGQDIVNHCVNDILVHGAKPLFFLDYVGISKFDGPMFHDVVKGICTACKENRCTLIGGETAEMPGLYPPGEYDLVGTMVGVVDRQRIITGRDIRPGDIVIGLPSSGLHTNGYSLARRVIFDEAGMKPADILPGTNRTVADALLAVHRSYLRPMSRVMKRVIVRGMAHITGGGFPDNIPRVLPKGTSVVIDRSAWNVPAVFRFIQEKGNVDRDEMYRVFNMGIGMVVIVREKDVMRTLSILHQIHYRPAIIGYVAEGNRHVMMTN
jgi:phosphoribosylformylglycinamidine cyclo-ligase